MTSQLIGLGLSDHLSSPSKCQKWRVGNLKYLTLTPEALNHQDPIPRHYRSPLMANRWPHWVGFTPSTGGGAVNILWQGEFHLFSHVTHSHVYNMREVHLKVYLVYLEFS